MKSVTQLAKTTMITGDVFRYRDFKEHSPTKSKMVDRYTDKHLTELFLCQYIKPETGSLRYRITPLGIAAREKLLRSTTGDLNSG